MAKERAKVATVEMKNAQLSAEIADMKKLIKSLEEDRRDNK